MSTYNEMIAGIELHDAWINWCEANDLDPDDPDTLTAEEWQADCEEDAAVDRYEADERSPYHGSDPC